MFLQHKILMHLNVFFRLVLNKTPKLLRKLFRRYLLWCHLVWLVLGKLLCSDFITSFPKGLNSISCSGRFEWNFIKHFVVRVCLKQMCFVISLSNITIVLLFIMALMAQLAFWWNVKFILKFIWLVRMMIDCKQWLFPSWPTFIWVQLTSIFGCGKLQLKEPHQRILKMKHLFWKETHIKGVFGSWRAQISGGDTSEPRRGDKNYRD